MEAFLKVAQITEIAESMNHHPELVLNYSSIEVRLWTHTCHAVTDLDINLASLIDQQLK